MKKIFWIITIVAILSSCASLNISAALVCPIKSAPSVVLNSDEPYDTPRYKTKDMLLKNFSTENRPGNSVWPERQVTYLTANQRKAYQLYVVSGLLLESSGSKFDTTTSSSFFSDGRAIFVMDHYGRIFVSECQEVGEFHHTSLVAGAPVAAAGELKVIDGVVLETTRKSGHYRPGVAYQDQLFKELQRQGIDTTSIVRSAGFP
jgi:hypothetical protein